MEKTIRELAAMTREELYAEAVIMRATILSLRRTVDYTKGELEMAERPTDTASH